MALVAPAARAQGVTKIGVFDSKVVFDQTAEGQRLQKHLNTKRDEYRASVNAKEEGLRALQQKMREGEFTLSAERKSLMQKDLQRKLVELDSVKQEANNNLRIELEDVQGQLDRKLLEVVQEVGSEGSFSLILERNTQVVYASDAVDISQLIVDRFNQKFPAPAGSGGAN
jgi:Skp family chaperone for outer membrane proteins